MYMENIVVIEEIGRSVTIGYLNEEGELEYNTYMHKGGGTVLLPSNAETQLIDIEGIADEHEVLINTVDDEAVQS